jgi:hypothetical protein
MENSGLRSLSVLKFRKGRTSTTLHYSKKENRYVQEVGLAVKD